MVVHIPSGSLPHRHVLAWRGEAKAEHMAHCGALTFPEQGWPEQLEFPSSATQNLPDAVEILCDILGKQTLGPSASSCYSLMFFLPVHHGQMRDLGWCSRRAPVTSQWALCSEVMKSSTAPRVPLHGSGNPRGCQIMA